MYKNYLTVAFRNILKYKFFSAVNILGMTAGITACLLILLYVQDELSFDRFNANADRIYQVDLAARLGGQDIRVSNTCPPMAAALVSDFPEIESATRIAPNFEQVVVKYDDKAFVEPRVFFADSNFFSFFSYPLLEGDPATVLKAPASVVLTQTIVKKYFGEAPAMGKLITMGNDNRSYTVTGIAKDSPANSHFRFDILVSASSSNRLKSNEWLNNYMFTYFTLREHASIASVEEKFPAMTEKYAGPEMEKATGTTLKQMQESGGAYGFFTTLVTDIHLRSTTVDGITPGGNVLYVYVFGIIAVFIMLIACINFMNMSTARSAGRAKEVGLRKTLGSLRSQMVGQFLAESMVYSLIAMMLALAATWILIPGFNEISGKEISIHVLLNAKFAAGVVGVVVMVGLVAGSYPAFYLTSFNAVEVLKGKTRAGVKSRGVRSALVVFQFGISILLITGTAIVLSQLQFMQKRDLGLDRKNVLYVHNMEKLGTSRQGFRNALNDRSDVTAASFTNNSFPGVSSTSVFQKAGSEQEHIVGFYQADYDHQDVMKFDVLRGRYFSRDFPSDSTAILINEAAAKEFEWKDGVGEKVIFMDDVTPITLTVVGVFKDFNFESLKERVRPMAIMFRKSASLLTLRYSGNPRDVVAAVEDQWRKMAPGEPLEYKFLDENYDTLFRAEQRLSTIFIIFSGLAIFIACLGLFALAAFTTEQRTKEIGIRKSMGASVSSLTFMVSQEFIKLVVIAFFLASIPAWFLADWWLSSFAYRVAVSPWIFAASGIGALAIAWLTVGYQSVKAANADPVKSLRYE